ncbi:SPFH domain-containing protein [Desulforegula conservatrix]|uniref:SPFH domain-containing protein n=1 Tax=Desulforegula conservatrix TaxID=153026 RepID=UPI000405E32C|nr:SPFH domain-containing protein [Desulforegula conservatrix]
MGSAFVVPLFIAVFVIILIVKGFKIVKQAETIIIERLGRYNRSLVSGINIIWPFIDQPRPINWRYTTVAANGQKIVISKMTNTIDLRETIYDFPRQNVITKDNVTIEIDAMIYFQVTDPAKSVYEVANLPDAIEKLTQTTLRNVIGELDFDECLVSRDTINGKLREILDSASDKWGVKVNRVELQDITPPRDIKEAMEKQMRAERDRRASILQAEGDKRSAILQAEGQRESEVNKAEGEKQAAILRAEGDAIARLKIAEAESQAIATIREILKDKEALAVNYLLAVRYIEALKIIAGGQDNKMIYMPYEASNLLGSLGGIKELFGVKIPGQQ